MKMIHDFLHIVFFIIVLCFISCSNKLELVVTPSTIFLETNEPGTKTNLFLQFKNIGTSTIKQIILKPSCSCYLIASTTTPLEPGKETKIPFSFLYPLIEGTFTDTVLIETVSGDNIPVLQQTVILVGTSMPTMKLIPTVLKTSVFTNVSSQILFFQIQNLENEVWETVETKEITTVEQNNPSEFIHVKLNNLNINKIGGYVSFDLTKDVSLPIIGSITFEVKSRNESREINLPFQLYDKRIVIQPEILTISSQGKTEFTIESYTQTELESVILTHLQLSIPFEKEVIEDNSFERLIRIKLHMYDIQLPANFRFGIVELRFSDGSVIKKNVVVK